MVHNWDMIHLQTLISTKKNWDMFLNTYVHFSKWDALPRPSKYKVESKEQ